MECRNLQEEIRKYLSFWKLFCIIAIFSNLSILYHKGCFQKICFNYGKSWVLPGCYLLWHHQWVICVFFYKFLSKTSLNIWYFFLIFYLIILIFQAVVIPKDREEEKKEKFKINQFNLVASEMISLNRSLADVRLPA